MSRLAGSRHGDVVKVWMRLDVGAWERFGIAKYFKKRGVARATRLQVQRFAKAALRSAVREQAEMLTGRALTTAQRLGRPRAEGEVLAEPREKQRSLAW